MIRELMGYARSRFMRPKRDKERIMCGEKYTYRDRVIYSFEGVEKAGVDI